ncbi:MAG: HAMP domain-containing sensor histidine kinase, partial [Verrucomicrobiota bacterium]
QAITDLAFESDASIEIDEFRTLNRSLDNAIAAAVTEFNCAHDSILADRHALALNERLGVFAHELRNIINTATLAFTAVKSGNVGLTGATGAVLHRSLVSLRNVVDRSLSEVRMTAGLPLQHRVFSLADFIFDVKVSASLEAQVRQCGLAVSPVETGLAVDGDRELLLSSVGNLLQNAFKFTHPGTEVTLSAYPSTDRILIEVADQCGGLPPGKADNLFKPFTQASTDKSGMGLGLSIARRSVEANGGMLSVRDMPGEGCVFAIDLPRHAVSEIT